MLHVQACRLTVEEIPSHQHNYRLFSQVGSSLNDTKMGKLMSAMSDADSGQSTLKTPNDGGEFHIYSTGGNAPHTNLAPVYGCYRFIRTA